MDRAGETLAGCEHAYEQDCRGKCEAGFSDSHCAPSLDSLPRRGARCTQLSKALSRGVEISVWIYRRNVNEVHEREGAVLVG